MKRLQLDTMQSLTAFADRQRRIWEQTHLSRAVLLCLLAGNTKPPKAEVVAELEAKGVDFTPIRRGVISKGVDSGVDLSKIRRETIAKGVPLRQFYDTTYKELVKPTLERLAKERALDLNDYTGRNSLRNLAEMECRYQAHKDDIAELKQGGAKLVICSSHADCSKRCAPYQGQIYSLDGTSGVIDGKKYVPLEEATQNPKDRYTTKAGRVYQNGLLGFNCRHKLTEYKGQEPQTISEEERKREYEITQRQRYLERTIRSLKAKAEMVKPFDKKEYQRLMAKAKHLNEVYEEYSKRHNRAFYRLRTSIK